MGNTWQVCRAFFVSPSLLTFFCQQFKDFLSNQYEPTQIFGSAKGFYVRYIEDIPDPCVKLWNVLHISLSRKSRHLDRVAQKQVARHVYVGALCEVLT